MAKDRNYKFWVKATDEALMFQRVDVEAEGLYSKMRRDAFQCEPRGFLVDFRGTPINVEDLADGYMMTNGRFKARLQELHGRQIIQTAKEYEASLRTVRTAWATKKVVAFAEILGRINGDAGGVYVIPALVDDLLESMVGSSTGSTGWEQTPDGGRRRRSQRQTPHMGTPIGGASTTPHMGTPIGGANRPPHMPHSQSQRQKSESGSTSSPERERDLSPRGREDSDDGKPMPWQVYTARAHEIQVWLRRQPEKRSEEAFTAAFESEFQMTWSAWSEIKRRMELAIPRPCQDGNHFFDEGSDYCRYCPYIRVGEEEATGS